jgi:uncharacterized protein (TIGR02757 family)
MDKKQLKSYLDGIVDQVNKIDFIKDDPISIPRAYDRLEDIEISAFWVAMLSWGQRKTIINKSKELFGLMDNAPYDFIVNHQEKDRSRFTNFKHRTFQYTDTLHFLEFFQWYYNTHSSLEEAFDFSTDSYTALSQFHNLFFHQETAPQRTRKHVSTPIRNSSCKRLNMFLRWMVRKDNRGVDFGLWSSIPTSKLMIPLDVHVDRIARELKLLTRTQRDWKSVIELTDNLKELDPIDPVRYDYALFGAGVLDLI